jgi:hypothetical protein
MGIIFISPVLARKAISVTYWSPSCWHCISPLATKPWSCRSVRAWYHGVDPMYHPGFQTPGFTKCSLTGAKSPVGLIHIFQLCLSCQSLVQSESKVWKLWNCGEKKVKKMSPRYLTLVVSCSLCPLRVSYFRPLESLFLLNETVTIFCGLKDSWVLSHHCCTVPKAP